MRCLGSRGFEQRANELDFAGDAWLLVVDVSSLIQILKSVQRGLTSDTHDWEVEDFRPIVETVLEQFGPYRTMFGSNFPVEKLYSDYSKLAATYRELIPVEMHDAVFRKTALRFYELESNKVHSPLV